MLVDLAGETGNPRQLQVLAASLGVSAMPDAARLLTRLRHWAADDYPSQHHAMGMGTAADQLRPRIVAQAVGWRGDPSVLVAALTQARIVERAPSGVRLRAPYGAMHDRTRPGEPAPHTRRTGQRHVTMPAPALWQAALGELAALMNRANYDAFLADTDGLYCEHDWLTVGVPSAYALAALADRFRSAMEWALYVVCGQRLHVRLVHAPPAGPLAHLPPRDG